MTTLPGRRETSRGPKPTFFNCRGQLGDLSSDHLHFSRHSCIALDVSASVAAFMHCSRGLSTFHCAHTCVAHRPSPCPSNNPVQWRGSRCGLAQWGDGRNFAPPRAGGRIAGAWAARRSSLTCTPAGCIRRCHAAPDNARHGAESRDDDALLVFPRTELCDDTPRHPKGGRSFVLSTRRQGAPLT